jgi:hypothetical protein
MLEKIANGAYENLSNLEFKDYENKNTPTESGFVAYAFADENNANDTIYAFRDSEGQPVGSGGVWERVQRSLKRDKKL